MKEILIAAVLILVIWDSCIAQSNDSGKKFGISMDFDLVVRDDDLDQEGIGFAFSLGGVKYIGDSSGRYRLIPSVEYGSFKWEENDFYNKYVSLNLIGSMDLIKGRRYSIPVSGGLVLDYSKSKNGESRIRESYKLYFGSRINLKSNWAIEFLNLGLSVNSDFLSIKMNYIRLEYQF